MLVGQLVSFRPTFLFSNTCHTFCNEPVWCTRTQCPLEEGFKENNWHTMTYATNQTALVHQWRNYPFFSVPRALAMDYNPLIKNYCWTNHGEEVILLSYPSRMLTMAALIQSSSGRRRVNWMLMKIASRLVRSKEIESCRQVQKRN